MFTVVLVNLLHQLYKNVSATWIAVDIWVYNKQSSSIMIVLDFGKQPSWRGGRFRTDGEMINISNSFTQFTVKMDTNWHSLQESDLSSNHDRSQEVSGFISKQYKKKKEKYGPSTS